MMISFLEAATKLESLCAEIDDAEELTEQLKEEFDRDVENLAETVDKRISFIKYAESQIKLATEMQDQWIIRKKKFQTALESVKNSTMDMMKSAPNLPYKGNLGNFRIQKNSVPTLICNEEWFLNNDQCLRASVDLGAVRDRIKRGDDKEWPIEVARLEYGEHLRIGVGK